MQAGRAFHAAADALRADAQKRQRRGPCARPRQRRDVEAFALKDDAPRAGTRRDPHNFRNPHGLHDSEHFTTPRDLALIARAAMQQPLFRQIVGTVEHPWTTDLTAGSRCATTTVCSGNFPAAPGSKPATPSRAASARQRRAARCAGGHRGGDAHRQAGHLGGQQAAADLRLRPSAEIGGQDLREAARCRRRRSVETGLPLDIRPFLSQLCNALKTANLS